MLASKFFAEDRNLAASGGNNIYTYTYENVEYKIHKFTANGDFILNFSVPLDVVVVGGGGSAGEGTPGIGGSGGGAGGLIVRTNYMLPSATYSVVIGAGGAHPTSIGSFGNDGGHSYFGYTDASTFKLKAFGGGGGGAHVGGYQPGRDGGSGGGGSYDQAGGSSIQDDNNGGTGYGNNGGTNPLNDNAFAGGGGGAGANDATTHGGTGKTDFLEDVASTAAFLYAAQAGTNSSNSATSGLGSNPGTLYLAGGGGGGADNQSSNPRQGGAGGGGDGGVQTGTNADKSGDNGLANTGGGGGGHARGSGQNSIQGVSGDGGSGIVIIRYRLH